MLGDRYSPSSPPGGLLFYLKGGHMQGLPALPHEKRGVCGGGEEDGGERRKYRSHFFSFSDEHLQVF